MPPRYAYWTILVDDAPTAFRSGSKEELLPTFNRLKEKHTSAVMKWWQNGKLWDSRLDAQEAMRARGEIGRRNDSRQSDRPRPPARRSFSEGGSFGDRDRGPRRSAEREGGPDWKPRSSDKPEWKPRADSRADWSRKPQAAGRKPEWKPKTSRPQDLKTSDSKLDWKPKGEFIPAEKRERPDWKPKASRPQDFKTSRPHDLKTSESKLDWKPKGKFTPAPKREWKSEAEGRGTRRSAERDGKPEWNRKPQAAGRKPLDWTPKSGYTNKADRPATEKRQWVPKAEYKKSLGIEPKRDDKWRPGGEHRDPKQKYKDAKKAKWTKFKKTIRTRWEAKGGKKDK